MIMALGLVAFVFDTVAGVFFAKVLNIFSRTKINQMCIRHRVKAGGQAGFLVLVHIPARFAAAQVQGRAVFRVKEAQGVRCV